MGDEIGLEAEALEDSETICGPTTDWQDVEVYDGTLGPSTAFVDSREGAVGYIPGRCSGTLISYNLFLTAGHCFSGPADAEGLVVRFNYQDDPMGNPRPVDEYAIVDLVEHRDDDVDPGNLDYAIVRLEGSPGYVWGYTPISASLPGVGSTVTLIQHPSGIPKVIEAGPIASAGAQSFSYSGLDTLGGSSGSGVLDSRGRIVGVHENGGCTSSGGANGATRIDAIIDAGTILGGQDHLWLGRSDDDFDAVLPADDAGGTYVALGGDFDGDGRGDIFWYGRGGVVDSVWYGSAIAGDFTGKAFDVDGSSYEPVVGDFDGDGRDDIFWYGPGGAADTVWYGAPGRTFTSKAFGVSGSTYRPVVADFDDDGRDDIFWYGPGGASDSVWYGAAGRTFTGKAFTVSGSDYRPVAGDFDGDGRGDIFWYRPGSGSDSVWWGSAGRTFSSTSATVTGHYAPFAGDFDGDGRDDIFWYGPGSNPDFVWYGSASGSFTSREQGVSGLYTPVTGRFDANARTDIFWYRPG